MMIPEFWLCLLGPEGCHHWQELQNFAPLQPPMPRRSCDMGTFNSQSKIIKFTQFISRTTNSFCLVGACRWKTSIIYIGNENNLGNWRGAKSSREPGEPQRVHIEQAATRLGYGRPNCILQKRSTQKRATRCKKAGRSSAVHSFPQ